MNEASIRIDAVGDELQKIVEKYGESAIAKALEVLEETAEKAKIEVSASSPVGNHQGHHLRDSWTITEVGEGYGRSYYVWASKWHRASIVHLLENGHSIYRSPAALAKPTAKPLKLFVQPRPFLGKVQEDAGEYFMNQLIQAIENGVEP